MTSSLSTSSAGGPSPEWSSLFSSSTAAGSAPEVPVWSWSASAAQPADERGGAQPRDKPIVACEAISAAVTCLRHGGVLAYPTEAVWGLGCDPFNPVAVARLLRIKQRDPAKGVILIAAHQTQLMPWLTPLSAEQRARLDDSWPGPHTWLVPDPEQQAPVWIRGAHRSVALRVTDHPLVVALCEAFGGPIVSTSANLAGRPSAMNLHEAQDALGSQPDGFLDGPTGGRSQPSQIRDLMSGDTVRAG